MHPVAQRVMDFWAGKEARLTEGAKAGEAALMAALEARQAKALYEKIRRSCRAHAENTQCAYEWALLEATAHVERGEYMRWMLAAPLPVARARRADRRAARQAMEVEA